MTEFERVKKALELAINGLEIFSRQRGDILIVDMNLIADSHLKKVRSVLNPPPVYEEVELKRWECKTCGAMFKTQAVNDGNSCCWGIDTLIPLTGTIKRPVPAKVERSVTVEEVQVTAFGGVRFSQNKLFTSVPVGKTGTLTFTWEE
jgi:hypothetical protein